MNEAQPWPTGDLAFAGLHSKAGHPTAIIDELEYKQYINSFAVSQLDYLLWWQATLMQRRRV